MAKKVKRLYKKKSWKGNDSFHCDLCPASSLDEKVMRSHIYAKHFEVYVLENKPKEETKKLEDNE